MTIEQIKEQKDRYQGEANYFFKISFNDLAKKFQDVVNILNEFEKTQQENEQLKKRSQELETTISQMREGFDNE